MSRRVPGGFTSFAGTVSTPWVVMMVDTARADTVREALAQAFSADTAFGRYIRSAAARPVLFSLDDLMNWQTYITGRLFQATGDSIKISSVGVNALGAKVVVEIPGEPDRKWVESTLSTADIPCGLVLTKIGPQWIAPGGGASIPATRKPQ